MPVFYFYKCYTESMQPSEGNNYWNPETDEAQNFAAQEAPEVYENETPYDEMPLLEPISWEASEYIHHDRNILWFVSFIVITILLLLLSIFVVKNYFFTALIVVMAVALGVYTQRPPRVIKYTISKEGLQIGNKTHLFSEYRAFGIIQDGGIFAAKLLPTARFGQEITLYFTENEGEKIVDLLGAFLPMEDLHLDVIDTLLRRLRL